MITRTHLLAVAGVLILAAHAPAQFSMDWKVVAPGGECAGQAFTLTCVLAQPAVGDRMASGPFALTPGFLLSATPPPPTCTRDFNGDGDLGTDSDIAAFFSCLAGNCCANCGSADFNGDGDIGTDGDIESFFRVLGGGHC